MTPLISATLLRAQSDRRLVQLVQAGHEAAFTTIVERYRAQLARYCLRLLPEARVDDAVQQAFLQAWRALQDGREIRELRPWLYAIVHNAAVSQLRTGVYDYVELLDTVRSPEIEPPDDLERKAVMRQTLSAVAALPGRQRDALLAVVLDDRPQAQVATEMGLSENGLRQLVFRARTTLRTATSALTPLPLLAWVLRGGSISSPGGLGEHVAEATAGAGAVGGAHVVGAGTALVVAGTLAVTGTTTLGPTAAPERSAAGAPTPAHVAAASPANAQVAGRTVAPRLIHRGRSVRVTATRLHRGTGIAATLRRTGSPVATLRGDRGLRVVTGASPMTVAHPVIAEAAPETVVLMPEPAAAAPPPPVASAATAPAQPQAPPAEETDGDEVDGGGSGGGDGGDQADGTTRDGDGGDHADDDSSDGGGDQVDAGGGEQD